MHINYYLLLVIILIILIINFSIDSINNFINNYIIGYIKCRYFHYFNMNNNNNLYIGVWRNIKLPLSYKKFGFL
jgi:hypothetical protein